MRHGESDEPYVIIQERSSDVGSFLLGIAIGAGVALLLAPRSGAETRAGISRRVQRAKGGVAETFSEAREKVEARLESARAMVERRRRQVADAVETGRAVAREAREEMAERLQESRARPTTEG